jgi:hypothetical protein
MNLKLCETLRVFYSADSALKNIQHREHGRYTEFHKE